MKQLLLIRHAKSSWDDPSQPDFERPLNDRGKKDAPEMAKRLSGKKIKPELFVSSPARRAKKTAIVFAKEFDEKKDEVILKEELYMGSEEAFMSVITSMKNKYDTIAIFSHNPGITDFANSLTDARIDNIPTCGVFAVKADTDDWSKFADAKKEFWFFDYPKQPG
jgi:phosphohistidine phosphatase